MIWVDVGKISVKTSVTMNKRGNVGTISNNQKKSKIYLLDTHKRQMMISSKLYCLSEFSDLIVSSMPSNALSSLV